LTLGLPSNAKLTVAGQYNVSPLEPKGASALYEFQSMEGHQTRMGWMYGRALFWMTPLPRGTERVSGELLGQVLTSQKRWRSSRAPSLATQKAAAAITTSVPRQLSWVPNQKTVIHATVNTQAPAQAMIRCAPGIFEQVNLPPSFEHYLHTEIGASRLVDDATKVSVALLPGSIELLGPVRDGSRRAPRPSYLRWQE
jgi:hypothetical protein